MPKFFNVVFSFFCFFLLFLWWYSFLLKFSLAQEIKPSSTQSKKERMLIGGDEGIFKKNYVKFSGNAFVKKGSVEMKSDLIEYFENTNVAYGYGNVSLIDPKSGLLVKGDRSVFWGDHSTITFFDDPVLFLTNDDIKLTGDSITLVQTDLSVFSDGNSLISSKGFSASADKVHILNSSNYIKLVGNSIINYSNLVLESDNGIIYLLSKTNNGKVLKQVSSYTGTGKVFVSNNISTLRSQKIFIDFAQNNNISEYIAVGEVFISNKDSIISSEYFRSVFTNDNKDIFHIALTNVAVINLSNGDIISGDYLFSDKLNNYEVVMGNAVYYSKPSDVKVFAEVIEKYVRLKKIYLSKGVNIQMSSASIVGDIAIYDEVNKNIEIFGNPKVVRSDRLGIVANVILLNLEKNQVTIKNGKYGYVLPSM